MTDGTYTSALENVYHTLGRIDGKLDSFDSRVRNLEAKDAARAAREVLEQQQVDQLRKEMADVKLIASDSQQSLQLRDALKKYWYLVAFVVAPVILNTIDTITGILRER